MLTAGEKFKEQDINNNKTLFIKNKIKNKQLYLSVRGFSTAVLIVDTINEQRNIVNRT